MTVDKLIKRLEKMRDKHGPRTPVSVNSDEMQRGCNRTFEITDVGSVKFDWIPTCDGDGGLAFRKDGTERGSWRIVLGA